MREFNSEQYREALRKKLGVKNMPMHTKVDFIRPSTSAIAQDPSEFGNDGGGEAAIPGLSDKETELSLGNDSESNEEVNQEQVEPALALLHTLLQSVDEQTQTSNDKETGVMWRSLHNYIWKNRNKIAKKMMDDAQ